MDSPAESLPWLSQRISFNFVKQGMIALLMLVLTLHAGFGCGVTQAAVTVEAPCCGMNCPFPCTVGGSGRCQAQYPGDSAQAVSAKATFPLFPPLAGFVHQYVSMPARTGFEGVSVFQANPPGAMKLALLCSRQI